MSKKTRTPNPAHASNSPELPPEMLAAFCGRHPELAEPEPEPARGASACPESFMPEPFRFSKSGPDESGVPYGFGCGLFTGEPDNAAAQTQES